MNMRLLVAVGCAAALVSWMKFTASDDVWLHLAAGRWIAEHREVPRTDPFSYSITGKPWVYHEWLAALLWFSAELAGGLTGLEVLRTLTVAGAFAWTAAAAASAPWWAGMVLGVWGALAVRPFVIPRPHLFSWVLFSALWWFLVRGRHKPAAWLGLPAGLLLWVNMHGSFVHAYATAGLFAVGTFGEALISGKPLRNIRKHYPAQLAVLVACAVLPLINPYGLDLIRLTWATITQHSVTRDLMVAEWTPPELGRANIGLTLWFAGAFLVTGMAFWRERWGVGLALAFQLVLAFQFRRVVPYLVLAALPIFLEVVEEYWGKIRSWLGKESEEPWLRWAAPVWSLALTGVVLLASLSTPRYPWGHGRLGFLAPSYSLDFLGRHPELEPIYNSSSLGGELVWRVPGFPSLCDGRNVEFDEIAQEPSVEALRRRFGFKSALVHFRDRRASQFVNSDWILVGWDSVALVFVRREAGFEALIKEFGYPEFNPQQPEIPTSSERREIFSRFLERSLAECPGNHRAALWLGRLAESGRNYPAALRYYRQAQEATEGLDPVPGALAAKVASLAKISNRKEN